MKLWELIKIANRNLFRNKLRTFLTIMAIFIGSFTLVLTNGLGDGLRDYIENQVKNLEASNIVFIRKKFESEDKEAKVGSPTEYRESAPDESGNLLDPNSMNISQAQIETALKEIGEVRSITPHYETDGEYITLDGAKKYQLALGMLSEGLTQKTEAGKTIDGANQILLPLGLARAFSENIEVLIGKTATIAYKDAGGMMKTLSLQIVGVATKGFISNYNCFVDAQTAKRIYEDQTRGQSEFNKFRSFTVQLNTNSEKRVEEIKKKLGEKGFSAETYADQKKRTYDAIGVLQIGLNLFAFIALLAASFGIINTLVIAVLERTKEIGLQKALGMGRGKVFLLFSLESVLIGFWGALLGIAGGLLIGIAANGFLARTYLESFEGYSLFVFRLPSMLFVIILVCAIAFIAGVLPAFRASRLNPIEALRYE
ncbi:MAG TPA: FtsX-like permease family protein [Pyrinomonadaceae bacterium]|jgi:putative ABC transport system permease protein